MKRVVVSDEEFLTRREIAQRLRVSERTVARWVRDGAVKPHRFGSTLLRFRWSEVQQCLAEIERDYEEGVKRET